MSGFTDEERAADRKRRDDAINVRHLPLTLDTRFYKSALPVSLCAFLSGCGLGECCPASASAAPRFRSVGRLVDQRVPPPENFLRSRCQKAFHRSSQSDWGCGSRPAVTLRPWNVTSREKGSRFPHLVVSVLRECVWVSFTKTVARTR
jgi:hypothetical protein